MVHYKFNKFSNNLGYINRFQIMLNEKLNRDEDIHLIICLHGLWGNESDFEKYNIEFVQTKKQVLFLFPNAHNSYYLNTKTGENFRNYIGIELVTDIQNMFDINFSTKSIIGISMGGYGAMYIGLTFPFNNITNLSGSVDLEARFKNVDDYRFYNLIDSVSDDFKIEKLLTIKENKTKRIYSYCGKNDFLYKDNQKINKLIKSHIQNYKIVEDEGNHSFKYWQNQIIPAINFMLGEDD